MILQRILPGGPAVRSVSANCVMNKEQEEMLVTTASAAGRTLASALKGVAETALKLMWSRSGGRHDTVLTQLKYVMFLLI